MDTNTRQTKRAPVTLKIKFKSATIDQFIERYAVDVSPGGIFIRTKEPLAVGTQMRFEFQLRDATPLIVGEGTVVWTRENDPARPNAAPGMGVRFDRLGDGSQTVLDKILAEKAKQPAAGPTDAPKSFTEVPTRVAPSPLVGALANEMRPKLGNMAPAKAEFPDERTDHTPLPRPMPFHSDADEFPEEAFEEATKVRSLDELVAQTAVDRPAEGRLSRASARSTGVEARAPLSETRPAVEAKPADAKVEAKPAAEPKVETKPAEAKPAEAKPAVETKPAVEAKPAVETKPAVEAKVETRPAPKVDTKPAVDPKAAKPADAKESKASSPGVVVDAKLAAEAKQTDELAARRAARQQVEPTPSTKPAKATATEAPKGKAAAAESKTPVAVIIGVLLAAIVSAAVWFMFLRKPSVDDTGTGLGSQPVGTAATPGTAGTATPGTATAIGTATPGTATPGTAIGTAGVGTGGSAVAAAIDAGATAMVATPVDAGAAVATPESGTVEIKASVAGAQIEVEGAGGGAAPYVARLERGKKYAVHVTADGYKPADLQVELGARPPVVKLEPLPRIVRVTSTPDGATIWIDGVSTGKRAPADVTLTKGQIGHDVRISLRRPGYAAFNTVVKTGQFAADGQALVAAVDSVLTKVVVSDDGPKPPGPGKGTGKGTGAEPTPDWMNKAPDKPAPDKPAPDKPAPDKGTGKGTAEPTPDWMNQ